MTSDVNVSKPDSHRTLYYKDRIEKALEGCSFVSLISHLACLWEMEKTMSIAHYSEVYKKGMLCVKLFPRQILWAALQQQNRVPLL